LSLFRPPSGAPVSHRFAIDVTQRQRVKPMFLDD